MWVESKKTYSFLYKTDIHVVHKHVLSICGAQNSKGGQLGKYIFSKGSWLIEGSTVTKEKKKKNSENHWSSGISETS